MREVILSQESSVSSAAEMTAQAAVRVVLVDIVARVTAAVEALAWNSAILVELSFSLAASFVVLAARSTMAVNLAISLHDCLVERVLVLLEADLELPFATTEETRREMMRLVNCILAVLVLFGVLKNYLEVGDGEVDKNKRWTGQKVNDKQECSVKG